MKKYQNFENSTDAITVAHPYDKKMVGFPKLTI